MLNVIVSATMERLKMSENDTGPYKPRHMKTQEQCFWEAVEKDKQRKIDWRTVKPSDIAEEIKVIRNAR